MKIKFTNGEIQELPSIAEVFSDRGRVLGLRSRPSIEALARCVGLSTLSSSGELWEYLDKSDCIKSKARPFLEKNDLTGWLDFCRKFNINKKVM